MNDTPVSIAALDAEWVGRALHEAGHDHPGIADIAVKPMPGIVGALGEVGILEVDYAAPCSLPEARSPVEATRRLSPAGASESARSKAGRRPAGRPSACVPAATIRA